MQYIKELYNGLNIPSNIRRIFINAENLEEKDKKGHAYPQRFKITQDDIDDLIIHV